MEKSLHFRTKMRSLFLMALFCLMNTAMSQVILNNQPSAFSVDKSSFNGITLTNTFNTFNTFDVVTAEGTFSELSAVKYTYTQEQGLPKLPVIRKLISIPVAATLEVRIVSADIKEYKLSDLGITHQLMPTQPPVPKNNTQVPDFVINRKAYSEDRFIGGEPATAEVIGILRDTRIARVEIAPVKYNPVTGIIRVYENLVVEVRFNGGDPEQTQALKDNTYSPYFTKLSSALANQLPLMPSRDYITQYPVKMVIVSDPMFQEALQPYIQWKTRKGFQIIEAYTSEQAVGNTTTSIKSYLQNLYNAGTPEDPSPTFVLFVGDVNQIPAFQAGHVTDLYYCEYTNDYLPEMYYGRFSANSLSELQPQIDKTLMYEQYQFPDPAFLGECVMISGVDANFAPIHGNGQITYGTTYYFNAAHGLLSHTYLYPQSGSSASQIIQNVSDGVGFANYTAHGSSSGWADPSFSISDIAGLQNNGEYPLMVGNCCQTSMYGGTCFAEALLRAENKGAVGYIGGSNNTYWDEDFYFGVGVGQITANPTYEGTTLGNYDRTFHDHGEPFADWYTTMDQVIFAGNLAVTEGSPGSAEYYWEIYCLMGDPSLMAYMGVPSPMNVTYDPLMPLSSNEFTVNAAPYAYVAISKEGVLYGTALADENGVAVVSLTPITVPGNADVVITAQNKQPYIGTVIVASPEGPYVLMESQIINDSIGNNNLQVDYNEGFGFNMTLKNVGNSDATDLTAVISTTCEYISIKTDTEQWGSIASGASATKTLAFELSTVAYLPDQCTANFTLQITDSTDTWESAFSIKLNAPLLDAMTVVIDDAQCTEPNGRLDAGETVQIKVPIVNSGHSDAFNSTTYLFTNSEYATITENAYQTGDLQCDSMRYALYEVAIADSAETGTLINFFTSANADPYFVTQHYGLAVGLIIEDFETGDFSAFNWVNTSLTPWNVNPLVHYNGLYCAKSGAIGDNQQTSLQIDMDVMVEGNISFARKVSSESGYDFLKFYVDGSERGSWSGNMDWAIESYPVTQGMHTFKWTYMKDINTIGGADAAYIDDIIFPSANAGGQGSELTVHPFAYPTTACQAQDINLFAFVTNNAVPANYMWDPAEMLNAADIYNPVATVGDTTVFTITINSGFSSDQEYLTVYIDPIPETPVITQQDDLLISSAVEGNQWYNREGAISGATSQTFEPTVTDYYHVVVTTTGGCESEPSNEIYMEVVDVNAPDTGPAFNVYPNPFNDRLFIDFSQTAIAPVRISLINHVGQEVSMLFEANSLAAGNYHHKFKTDGFKSGVYFLKLKTGYTVRLKKVILFE